MMAKRSSERVLSRHCSVRPSLLYRGATVGPAQPCNHYAFSSGVGQHPFCLVDAGDVTVSNDGMLTAETIWRSVSYSADPLNLSARVRPCTVSIAMPLASAMRAISTPFR